MPYRVIQISKLSMYASSAFEPCFIPIGKEFSRKSQVREFIKEIIESAHGEEFIIIKTYAAVKIYFGEPD